MRSGILRHKIRIEVGTSVKDEYGAVDVTWNLYRSVWANIETLKGRERQAANASWPTSDKKISLRYVAGLLPTMRIVYDDVVYSILDINDFDLRHRDMEIICQTGDKAQ